MAKARLTDSPGVCNEKLQEVDSRLAIHQRGYHIWQLKGRKQNMRSS
jgi:hypothetical protein